MTHSQAFGIMDKGTVQERESAAVDQTEEIAGHPKQAATGEIERGAGGDGEGTAVQPHE